MNQAVRFLERPPVVRLFGIALMLAPIVNIWIAVAVKTQVQTNWNLELLWRIAAGSLKVPTQILYVSSMVIGASMLRGRPSAWKFVMGLLGGYILLQFTTLIPDMRRGWAAGFMFLVNISIFYFIADQLVWKLQLPARKPAAPKVAAAPPAPATIPLSAPIPLRPRPAMAVAQAPASPAPRVLARAAKPVVIAFEGLGPWAELADVTKSGLILRQKNRLPFEFAERELEIQLRGDLKLRLRFEKSVGDQFFFGFTKLRPEQVRSLNHWLRAQVAA